MQTSSITPITRKNHEKARQKKSITPIIRKIVGCYSQLLFILHIINFLSGVKSKRKRIWLCVMCWRSFDFTTKTSEVRPPMIVFFCFFTHYPYSILDEIWMQYRKRDWVWYLFVFPYQNEWLFQFGRKLHKSTYFFLSFIQFALL